ncbi:phosphoglucosamine mutase [Paraflavisolibacter sp. H34]|uniref:phosphoglucosamine mutase n=1 Tax=Huijunlia imazamoxiresistens TaxID=3127457 RepID=UPI003017B349
MSLIKSISGIRGTIGGRPGENLTPLDIVKFTAAYATWLQEKHQGRKVVIGRDGRISGSLVSQLTASTLLAMGIDVVDAGLSTTPTVEMAVVWEAANGGIILTASHNPAQWNALKLLNGKGEFLSAEDGAYILEKARQENFDFAPVTRLGRYSANGGYIRRHIDSLLQYPLVDTAAIRQKAFTVVVDAVNSTGALALPPLLKALGVANVVVINEAITGQFAHDPEPLPQHLEQLCSAVSRHGAHLGIAVDPDVDRLCFVCEDGSLFGEEYTLVAVADYILGHRPGNTVSNLSSTRALKDVTLRHGGAYFASAVGEVNVVQKMKEVQAVIGGEGNGGIIVPDLHYGRDALAGTALFLSALAREGGSLSAFRQKFPGYFMAKKKLELSPDTNVPQLLAALEAHYGDVPRNTADGLKIDLPGSWIHLRSSNTEPIIRVYTEAPSAEEAEALAHHALEQVRQLPQRSQLP